jgi:hypothetical protein
MNNGEFRQYEMLRRVRDFGVAHAVDFPANTLGSALFATVGTTVTEIEQVASTQTSKSGSSLQETESKSLAREALLEEMEAISMTARARALDNPGLENQFRVPRSCSDQALLNAARAFLTDATPLAAEFIRHEMATDFLDDLRSAIEDFEHAITDRNHNREGRVSATASLDIVIAKGVKQAKQLNAVVRNKYRNDPAMLAAWTSASHVERRKSRGPSPEPPPSDVPPRTA